jgi:methanogenic corrinoid protein MtbC1
VSLPLADVLLLDLAAPDRRTAAAHCATLIRNGLTLDRLVDEGLAPAMTQVGSLWQTAVWTVVDEHTATAVAEAGLSAAAAECDAPRVHREVVLACAEGDWHSLPARMVAEVLVTHGWPVRFLGASHPTDILVDHLVRHRPDAVLLSCAVPMALPALMRAVQDIRGLDLPVYVGGRALGNGPRRAWALGADGWAPDAAGAVELLTRRPRHTPAHDVTARLDAYRARQPLLPGWADDATGALAALIPVVGDYSPEKRDRTRADLAHLLDMASVTLLLEDPTLLAEQCDWLNDVLAARCVPPDAVTHGLTALLGTSPRTEAAHSIDSVLRHARQHLAGQS